MRGLKLFPICQLSVANVASFTDAWIETSNTSAAFTTSTVASFTDAWIETKPDIEKRNHPGVASFTDAWIETQGTGV